MDVHSKEVDAAILDEMVQTQGNAYQAHAALQATQVLHESYTAAQLLARFRMLIA